MAGEEMARGDDCRALVKAVEPLVAANVPIFLTGTSKLIYSINTFNIIIISNLIYIIGDFNSPSHLDWTEDTVLLRKQMKYPVPWPITYALMNAGMRDTYRELYPNPVTDPGITFTPGQPRPRPVTNEVLDRIDFIFTAGPVKVQSCEVTYYLLVIYFYLSINY